MTKTCQSDTLNRAYFMVDPSTHVTVTPPSLKPKQKVLIELDKYAEYAHNLTHIEASRHLIALRSKSGAVMIKQQINGQTKSVLLNACDHYNLFSSNSGVAGKKAKVAILSSPPVHATSVTISLVRSGKHTTTNFTEHLKIYFGSPKILRPGHVFCVKIPVCTPSNIPLTVWLKHAASNKNFIQPSYSVYFKVISAAQGESKLSEFFYISSEKTTLYEVPNIHETIPTFVPNQRLDSFYSSQMEVLKSQLQMDIFLPIVLSGEKGMSVAL